MKVHAIGRFGTFPWYPIYAGFREGLDRIEGVEPFYAESTDPRLVEQLNAVRADVVIVLGLGAWDRWRDTGRDTVNWDPFVAVWNQDYRPWVPVPAEDEADLVVATDADWADAWLPLGCMERDSIPDATSSVDLAIFYGTKGNEKVHGRRREILEGVYRKLEHRTAFYNFQGNDSTFHQSIDDQARLYAGGGVCLDCSNADRAGYTSDRIFTVTGSGGFYFGNWFDRLDELFEPGIEIAWPFQDEDDTDAIVSMAVDWADPRREDWKNGIRKAGFRRAQADHTYVQRVAKLWTWIKLGGTS